MSLTFEKTLPPLRIDENGVVRIRKTRVTLSTLAGFYNQGQGPRELANAFPTLSLAEIYGASSYCLNHRQATDAYLDQLDREAELLRKEIESQPESIRMRRLLVERMKQREENSAPLGRG
jgi:uncharacterized protein (DUF433 family)